MPSGTASEDPRLRLTLRADPAAGTPPCPLTVRFSGDTDGPTQIVYTWDRGDGATAPKVRVVLDGPGSQRVETTWTRGADAGTPVSGWERLGVLSPVAAVSGQAAFDLTCG